MKPIVQFVIVCAVSCLAAAHLHAAQSSATTLSVTANDADSGDNALLLYTWSALSGPGTPTFGTTNGLHTGLSCSVTVDTVGDYVFRVTVSDTRGGIATSDTGPVHCTQAPLNTTAPTLSGTVRVGQIITATSGVWTNPDNSATYTTAWSWQRADDAAGTNLVTIAGASAATYLVTIADMGKHLRARQTATNAPYAAARSANSSFTRVDNTTPTVATAASATASPVTGTSTTLSVLGADDAGEAALTYTWSTSGTPPAAVVFSANGTNAAKHATANFTKAGTYNLVATISDTGNLSVTSSLMVTVNQTLTSITVGPASPTILVATSRQFSATGVDQFGTSLASQPTFTWAVVGGGLGGSVSASGLYTAPATGTGSDTVRATSSAVNGSTVVTISSSPGGPIAVPAGGAGGGGCGAGGLVGLLVAALGLGLRRRQR
jgi:hypothetical protein